MTFNERKGRMHILSMKYVSATNHNDILLYARRIIFICYNYFVTVRCAVTLFITKYLNL